LTHTHRFWPVELLSEANFTNFQYQYFRKDAVVVNNNQDCPFIIFIKSGQCKIVCSLQEESDCKDLNQLEDLLGRMYGARGKLSISRKSLGQNRSQSQRGHKRAMSIDVRNHLTKTLTQEFPSYKLDVAPLKALNRRYSAMVTNVSIRSAAFTMDEPDKIDEDGHQSPNKYKLRSNKALRTLNKVRQSVVEDTPYAITKAVKHRDELQNWRKRLPTTSSLKMKANQTSPQYAQIAVLTSGHAFGLEELMKQTNLKLSLISDGAECISISKKMFVKHASGDVMRCISNMVGKYPTEDYIHTQLQEQNEWNVYRKSVISDVLKTKKHARRSMKPEV